MKLALIPTAVLCCVAVLPSLRSAERVALVIGNGDYAHVPKLANPANDAREVAVSLRGAGYEVTEVVDGTGKEMGVALRAFALAGRSATTAVFYYAGHGFEVEGHNYLAPVDAELAVDDSLSDEALDAALGFALDDETLPLESVLAEMRKEVAGLKLVVLDCCRDNPFARTRSWARSRSGGGGLAGVNEAQLPEGSMLVFSGEPGQQVPDGTGNHSPFTEAMLNEMSSAGGIPILTVFTGVATKVKGQQKPWIKFDGTGQSLHAFSTMALLPGPAVPVSMTKTDPAVPKVPPVNRGIEGARSGEARELGGVPMIWCEPGEFLMGSPEEEEGRGEIETLHRVTLTSGFWIARTELTQAQWEEAMGTTIRKMAKLGTDNKGLKGEGPDFPMYYLNWSDAQEYLEKLNTSHAPPEGWRWDLPTEAQWEYACRAGTSGPHAGELDEMAWFEENSGSKTNPVGAKAANAWGVHDMHGNLWEWCRDWFGDDVYEDGQTDPQGADSGEYRVTRGGSWNFDGKICRSAYRGASSPDERGFIIGFRPALVQSP